MIRVLAFIAAAAAAQSAMAQEWVATTTVGASERYTHSGSHMGTNTRDPEDEWLATEAFVVAPSNSLNCAQAQEIEIDHYYGVDAGYIAHLLVTAVREGKTDWRLYDPEVYFERVDRWDNPSVVYHAYPAQAKLLDWRCNGESVELSLSFKANLDRIEGSGPGRETVSGTATVQVRLQHYDNY